MTHYNPITDALIKIYNKKINILFVPVSSPVLPERYLLLMNTARLAINTINTATAPTAVHVCQGGECGVAGVVGGMGVVLLLKTVH